MPPSAPPSAPSAEDCAYSLLSAYCAYQWSGFRDAAHHRLICRELEAVERGETRRLILTLPPRHGKSLIASENFPAWYLGRNPDRYIIAATYAQELADDFGRRVRNQILDPSFGLIFPGISLRTDSKSAKRFSVSAVSGEPDEIATNRDGAYYAVGVGGPLTGRGAHCFVAGTVVETNDGPKQIEDFENCPTTIKVLSFNHETGDLEFKHVEAFARRQGIGIYRLTTASGRVVDVTGSHPFFTQKGYIKARSLAPGDRLVCVMPEEQSQNGVRLSKMGDQLPDKPLLFSGLQPNPWLIQKQAQMREMRDAHASQDNALLQWLQAAKDGTKAGLPKEAGDLSDMFELVSSSMADGKSPVVLQQDMRGHRSLEAHVGIRQSELEGRSNTTEATAAFGEGVPDYAQADIGAGWEYVRDLRRQTSSAHSPYRQLADEQQCLKSHNTMPFMPQESAQVAKWETEPDYVHSIERIGETARVFDLQVSENHNFFASGILVHNCLLIDDPLKNREEADSELIRKKLRDWYTSTAYTRLMPGGAIVIIVTRWHENDLVGWLLREHAHENWRHVNLPAIDAKGEALWPEQYDLAALEHIRRTIGPRDWSALYQQQPSPETGDYFKAEWIRSCEILPPTRNLKIYGASDYAVTADGGDFTVHAVVGIDPDNRMYLLDLWRGQASSDTWVEAFCDLVLKWQPIGWAEETGQITSGIGPFLRKRMMERRALVYRETFATRGDKAVRAQSIRGRMAMDGLYVQKDAPFKADLISELMSFPVGVHDDIADALGLVGQLLDRMQSGDPDRADTRPKPLPTGYVLPPPPPDDIQTGNRRIKL